MKRAVFSLIALLLALVQVSGYAQVTPGPALINFQGRLVKPDGSPVADGSYTITFSLWDAQAAGNKR